MAGPRLLRLGAAAPRRDALRALVDRDPTDHYAHHMLGRTLERQNKPREALPFLRLAAAMAAVPDYAQAVQRVETAC